MAVRTAAAAAAAAVPLEAQQPQQVQPQHRHPILELINESTKWAVSAAAFATLGWRRDLLSAWCVLGSIAAAFLCRFLKFAINESRPPAARKADPGMPSSHANSLAFLSTFVALTAAAAAAPTAPSVLVGSPAMLALVVGVPSLAIFLAWLRVALGYHTLPQVAVGWLVGSGTAAAWQAWGRRTVLPLAQQRPQLQLCLYILTALSIAAFVLKNVLRWARERQEQHHHHLASQPAPEVATAEAAVAAAGAGGKEE